MFTQIIFGTGLVRVMGATARKFITLWSPPEFINIHFNRTDHHRQHRKSFVQLVPYTAKKSHFLVLENRNARVVYGFNPHIISLCVLVPVDIRKRPAEFGLFGFSRRHNLHPRLFTANYGGGTTLLNYCVCIPER